MNELQASSWLRRFLPSQMCQQSSHMLGLDAAALFVKAPAVKVARSQNTQQGFGLTCETISAPVPAIPMSSLNRTAA
jgi:hypothetical protein